jgi:hypothetical protein
VNIFQPGQCYFSSSAQLYVRVSCTGTTVVPTITTTFGPGV